jgi:hypothetical protein
MARDGRAFTNSPLVPLLIVLAAALAVLSFSLAALPLPALKRLLSTDAHWQTEQVAAFVDDHRLDIVVAGIAAFLVAAVVALPTVTG